MPTNNTKGGEIMLKLKKKTICRRLLNCSLVLLHVLVVLVHLRIKRDNIVRLVRSSKT